MQASSVLNQLTCGPLVSAWQVHFDSLDSLSPSAAQFIFAALAGFCLLLALLRYRYCAQPVSLGTKGILALMHATALLLIGLVIFSPIFQSDTPQTVASTVSIITDQTELPQAERLASELSQRGIQAQVQTVPFADHAQTSLASRARDTLILMGTAGTWALSPQNTLTAHNSPERKQPIFFVRAKQAVAVPQVHLDVPRTIQTKTATYGTLEILSPPASNVAMNLRVDMRYLDSTTDEQSNVQTIWRTQVSGDERVFEFPIELSRTGLVEFAAICEISADESTTPNDTYPPARRTSVVTDGQSRLLYITNRPSWQCRFLCEALRRDEAFGTDAVRVYSPDVDRHVAENNDLYLAELPKTAAELMPYDIVILDDPAPATIPSEFANLLRVFVEEFGGGLILTAGAAHQGSAFAETVPELLPIVPPPAATASESSTEPGIEFKKPASQWLSVKSGLAEERHPLASANWFQAVRQIRPRTAVVAEHPTRTCTGQQAAQPLIATRQIGEGIVLWLATNETWRMRSEERGQAFARLWRRLLREVHPPYGVGNEKYFSLSCDRPTSIVDDTVTATARMYDREFSTLPSTVSMLTAAVESISPGAATQSNIVEFHRVADDLWQASWVANRPGVYTIRLIHPETGEARRTAFVCEPERLRNSEAENAWQQTVAQNTGGHVFEAQAEIPKIADRIAESVAQQNPKQVVTQVQKPLNELPLWFGLVVGLICTEWIARRWLGLT